MSSRTKVTGTRSSLLWLLILIITLLILGLAAGWFSIYPRLERQQQAERHYQAGVAFQNVGDWLQASTEYEQAIISDANYKGVQVRLVEVRSKLAEVRATATAAAVAQAESARTDAQATTVAVQATEVAAPTATAEALEMQYQKGLGYMNLEQWLAAEAELELVFEVDPNYREIQAQLAVVNSEIAKLTPTSTLTPIATFTPTTTPTPELKVRYLAHVGGTGWLNWVDDGRIAGTTDQNRQMEAIRIMLTDAPANYSVTYQAHVAGTGWLNWVRDGEIAGTTGQSRRLEAIRIRLVDAPPNYRIAYQAYAAGVGWMDWVYFPTDQTISYYGSKFAGESLENQRRGA